MTRRLYRIERGTHRTETGEKKEAGQTVELPESVAERLPDEKFTLLDEDDEEEDEEAAEEEATDYCTAELSSGEECGRERPCRYHS